MNEITTTTIRDYATGKVIGEAEVADHVLAAYEAQKIGQWPEGLCRAVEILSGDEIARLGIESRTVVWIDQ